MQASNSLEKITRFFHQDVFLAGETLDELLAHAIEPLTSSERRECKAFLGRLLDGSATTDQVRAVWNSLPKEIRIDDDDHMTGFLRTIEEML